MSINGRIGILLVWAALCGPLPAVQAQTSGFRFLATGDLPYTARQDTAFRRLLDQSRDEDFEFLVHVGDFKGGNVACSEAEFMKVRDMFRAYPKPVVYTPGDNEWTDCHGVGSNPIERLGRLRELFFHDATTLRLDKLGAKSQSDDANFSTYVENYRFTRDNVLFIVVHVVGSGNNFRADDPPSMQEFHARNAANVQFLQESFAAARTSGVSGVALVIHANPSFEKGAGPGFQDFLAVLKEFLTTYHQPVVCIHGDSHYFRIDKPLKGASGVFLNFTRLEVFGSPNVAGVVVSVDPGDPQVFSFRPYYLKP